MSSKKRKSLRKGKFVKKKNASKPPFHIIALFYNKVVEYLDIKSIAQLEIALSKRLVSDSNIDNTSYRKLMFNYACNEAFIIWILNRKLYLKHIIIDGSYFNDLILIQKYINNNYKFVETIRIFSLDDLTDEIIVKLIHNCLCINSIYINDCNMISDHFVASLLLLKPHLLSLSIIHCHKITCNIVKLIEKFKDLRKITLNNNVVTNEIDHNIISNLPKLRRFNLIENIFVMCYNSNNDNDSINSDGYSDNSNLCNSFDSVNTYSSDSDTDINSEYNISSDMDNNSILDSNESSISLNTSDSDFSCPLLVYNWKINLQ